MTEQQAELLFRLLSQPTAPFREEHVSAAIMHALDDARVPYCDDPHGNLVIGVGSRAQYTRLIRTPSREPVRVFIAHMDHPGFHGLRWSAPPRDRASAAQHMDVRERRPHILKIKWHGGSPVKHVNGAPVWLANDDGVISSGVLRNVKPHKLGYAIDSAEVHIKSGDLPSPRPAAAELFGGFKFRAPVWAQGKRVYTKAADDLIGVFCIVATAIDLFKRPTLDPAPFIGLCTRAEEVGFIGALGHFESGWLKNAKRPIVCVSLEASRTLPGAIVGNGPVVRLGDRRAVFDGDSAQLLTELAEKYLPKKFQRRVMDGGTCEGTAATAYGYPTIAMSVPLGNYHNQGYEGGPDCRKPQGPAPEFVHLDDIEGQRRLCLELMRPNLNWSDPWAATRRRLLKNFREYRRMLG